MSVGRSVNWLVIDGLDFQKDCATHVERNFICMMIVHPQNGCHGEDVEENDCQLDSDGNLCGESLINHSDSYLIVMQAFT